MDAKKVDFTLIFVDIYWFLLIFHWISLIFIDFHCPYIPKPSKNMQNHWKSFKIGAKSCKRIIKTHNFHQNQQLVLYECKNNRYFIDFYWFSLIFIDFHWFSLIFIDFPTPSVPSLKMLSIFFGPKQVGKSLSKSGQEKNFFTQNFTGNQKMT